jgi:hypothetical protein
MEGGLMEGGQPLARDKNLACQWLPPLVMQVA